MSAAASLPERIEAVRRFNRFYTRRIGVLREGVLHSSFTLTETRLLWELAHLPPDSRGVTVTGLAGRLDLDIGYLSRLLRGFKERGFIKSTRSTTDARQQLLTLTAAGRRAFAPLNTRSQEETGALLARLDDGQQHRLLSALGEVERLLDDSPRGAGSAYLLRPHRPGDMGWLVSRHGALYAQEYQWDMRFEALVARIAADFIERFDARREACWVAERDGANVGCVCLVQARDDTTQQVLPGVAQLRLLLVEPAARGLGLGKRLVAECTRFAREAGYQRIRLWTNSVLSAARAIYMHEGYLLTASEPHHSFGQDLIGETWELTLASTAP
ncbi:helix-turn-helix domain-containing GNAT family N-acetyltransferase [Piscinibacter sp. XHJ-5]|uniref:bifunctional helix-turn-helix transcriptional regulator/GNAT family N-acetyltransferase n=1 Tax=Piscinibacter sp. XHJ-5 TaxID=3037797 RepID=UPI002453046D|nr:helix-turn-helix domain-containing GNAT family N-acetyltransferase [Piscinibacter sp. XHJ-5]